MEDLNKQQLLAAFDAVEDIILKVEDSLLEDIPNDISLEELDELRDEITYEMIKRVRNKLFK